MGNDNIKGVGRIAKELGVSTRTIQREIQRGKLKAGRVGRKIFVTSDDLAEYLKRDHLDIPKELSSYIGQRKYEMISLLQKLVSIPSETGEGSDEERLAHHIKQYLDRFGIRNVIQGKGDSVAIHASFGMAEKGILLDCPLDTTHAGDRSKWKYPPYDGVIHGRRMYGRGVMDAKAGIVSMIYALLALKNVVGEEGIRVELVFDGGEQNGKYAGIREVLKKQLPIEAGIIGYAGDKISVGIGCRGYHRYKFITHGLARHTGSQHNIGINAISKMANFIVEMEKRRLPSRKSKYFKGPRMTFSIINGGEQVNIVPDICEAYLDVRTLPNQTHKDVEILIESVMNNIRDRDPEFNIEYTYEIGEEGYLLNPKEKIITALVPAIEEINKKRERLIVQGPAHIGTHLFHHYHIPMVVWGPVGGNAHSYDEYVEIESIHKTAIVYAQTVLNYFGLTK